MEFLIVTGLTCLLSTNAATNIVVNLKDGLTAGTLRSAIVNSSSGDTIIFSNGLTGTVSLTNGGQLLINKNITLQGPGAKVITISGNNTNRVFNLANANANISGLTIANGDVIGTNGISSNSGETVYGAGMLRLDSVAGYSVSISNCIFLNNSIIGGTGGSVYMGTAGAGGNAYGAAVFNNSLLTINNCTFVGNTAVGGNGGGAINGGQAGGTALGGAICNVGILNITNCTFTTNTTVGGTGGYGGQLFTGNGGNAEGGAVYNYAQLILSSCTISSNTATGGTGGVNGGAYGGGLRADVGSSQIQNTIVAGNMGSQAADVSGDFVSQGFNLVGNTNGSTGFVTTGDQAGTIISPINPLLGPLQDNGGPTLTMALQPNSPAVDRGNSFNNPADQRGATRPSIFLFGVNPGDGSDIGAFELVPPAVSITRQGATVVLCWSIYNVGLTLQAANDIVSSGWGSVSNTPVAVGDKFYFTNAIFTGNRFFRLH